MMMNYKNFNTEDFVSDLDFIQWVLNPSKESNEHWEAVIKNNPKKAKTIEKAVYFIRKTKPQQKLISGEDKQIIWDGIQSGVKSLKQKQRYYWEKISITAGIAVLVSLGTWFLFSGNSEIDYSALKERVSDEDNTRLILANESIIDVDKKESSVRYGEDGALILNNNRILDSEESKDINSGKEAMNQLVVPRGRRANISFSDGTKLWLNSGSHAIYPARFSNEKREIYIEGEAYLEVVKDKDRPFIIATKNIDVRVLGTSFNIKVYDEEEDDAVALVEGLVEIRRKNKKIRLSPNQLYSYNKNTNKSEVWDNINISEIIGWKDGWLLCNSEELTSIFKKLERYYDVHIITNDTNVATYKASGKLDLKDNIEDILNVISLTAPVKYTLKGDSIFVYDNN